MPTAHPTPELRPIQGFIGYAVSADGTVWSCYVHGQSNKFGAWRPLHPGRCGRLSKIGLGYLQVNLRCDKKRYMRYVHRLIAEAFIGPCPDGMEVCHNDGNPLNNRPENLRYDTRKGNHADRKRHGTYHCGTMIAGAKLDEEKVRAAREEFRKGGISISALGRKYGVEETVMAAALKHRTWRHV
jgi:hypothetical protein